VRSNGIYLLYDPALGSNWHLQAKDDEGADTVDSGVIASANVAVPIEIIVGPDGRASLAVGIGSSHEAAREG
jgi:hypothetical protein